MPGCEHEHSCSFCKDKYICIPIKKQVISFVLQKPKKKNLLDSKKDASLVV